ncbi:MAG: polysaccharide biosynthesis tyrosine autokinase [Bacteroidetes bacterium]|nr:polysaccharide biosynthesis tyrosine autokinase [Bacteroidota bacterium]
MSDTQQIKKFLLPAIKGFPVIALFFVVAMLFGSRVLYYATPKYESTALLKLDEKNNGVSDNNLYKDFDVFTATGKIATEERVIQSQVLIKKAMRNLDFRVSVFRIGDIRKRELYKSTPFFIHYVLKDSSILDKTVQMEVLNDSSYHLKANLGKQLIDTTGHFGHMLFTNSAAFKIEKNDSLIQATPSFALVDNYEFIIHSDDALFNHVIGEKLDVKAMDKDIPILRITYTSEVPQKSSDFANALAMAYITDYIESKSEAAAKTVQFIDDRLDQIGKELKESEFKLEEYRLKYKIINTTQETETGLRKLSQLKVEQTNLDMEAVALEQLQEYVDMRKDFNDAGPAFDAIADPLFTDMIKNLKSYQQERRELLTRFTPDHEKVRLIDGKIEDVITYSREAIRNAKNAIKAKRAQMDAAVELADHEFDNLPTKEKNMIVLERNFQLNQKVYQFLLEKRTEASIAEAATISFHRIIQYASVPTTPVYPKRGFLLILAGFTGLLSGILFVYLRRYARGKIEDKEMIEKMTTSPVAGVIREMNGAAIEAGNNPFSDLATNLILHGLIGGKKIITVTSSVAGEGKSFVAKNLALALARSGWKVVLADLNLHNATIHAESNLALVPGMSEYLRDESSLDKIVHHSDVPTLSLAGAGQNRKDSTLLFSQPNLKEKLEGLYAYGDIVILDTSATANAIDALALMKISGLNLYVVRSEFTSSHLLTYSEMLKQDYAIENMHIVLNGLHKATNFNGDLTGTKYSYQYKAKGWNARIAHYVNHYWK